ncbi:Abi-alpha family protein, partial [Acidocella sp.]|uniref:Abi-alpha family protein n=1 Tax=Acidocella sp. TaxID=50710 RepID=UPI0026016497
MIEIFHQGVDYLNAGEGDVRAGITAYMWSGVVLGQIKKYFGRQQGENIEAISKRAEEKLKDIPPKRKSPPPASVAEPLIEAAMQESRPELQELWAGLLASAMLDGGKNARYEFKDILEKLNPLDAAALQVIAKLPNPRWSQMVQQ